MSRILEAFHRATLEQKPVIHTGGESVIHRFEFEGKPYAVKRFHDGNPTDHLGPITGRKLMAFADAFNHPPFNPTGFVVRHPDIVEEDGYHLVTKFLHKPTLTELVEFVTSGTAASERREVFEKFCMEHAIGQHELVNAHNDLMRVARLIESNSFMNTVGARLSNSNQFLVEGVENGKLKLVLMDYK
jgi:hypothetical protein